MTSMFIKRGNSDRETFMERRLCAETQGDRHVKKGDWSVCAEAKGCQRLPLTHQQLGQRGSASQASEGTNAADALISGLWPPEL